jgi:hypothetical protein
MDIIQESSAEIARVSEEVLGHFSKIYFPCVGSIYLKRLFQPKDVDNQNYLLDPEPKSVDVIAEGYVTKRTAKSQWAKNYLVLRGENENFPLYYFPSEKEKLKVESAHGCIRLDGYDFIPFNEEESARFDTKLGFSLVPWSSSRRKWRFKFSLKSEYEGWESAIKFAMSRAKSSLTQDADLQKAFLHAYETTWQHFERRGPTPGQGGSEVEHLAGLVKENLVKSYSAEEGSSLKQRATNYATNTAIEKAVSLSWSGLEKIFAKTETAMKDTLANSSKELGNIYQELNKLAGNSIEECINATLKESVNPFVKELCPQLFKEIKSALLDAQRCWKEEMTRQSSEKLWEYCADVSGNLSPRQNPGASWGFRAAPNWSETVFYCSTFSIPYSGFRREIASEGDWIQFEEGWINAYNQKGSPQLIASQARGNPLTPTRAIQVAKDQSSLRPIIEKFLLFAKKSHPRLSTVKSFNPTQLGRDLESSVSQIWVRACHTYASSAQATDYPLDPTLNKFSHDIDLLANHLTCRLLTHWCLELVLASFAPQTEKIVEPLIDKIPEQLRVVFDVRRFFEDLLRSRVSAAVISAALPITTPKARKPSQESKKHSTIFLIIRAIVLFVLVLSLCVMGILMYSPASLAALQAIMTELF